MPPKPSLRIVSASEEEIVQTAETCLQALRETGAHVIVLGCIGFAGFAEIMRRLFAEKGVRCPIIEPGITVIESAKMLLRLGLNQSRVMWA